MEVFVGTVLAEQFEFFEDGGELVVGGVGGVADYEDGVEGCEDAGIPAGVVAGGFAGCRGEGEKRGLEDFESGC